ncbi:MAG: SRPBCC family protein [Ekhidna sp.]|uniref:SRPBCC family protein n=1 Tax=Ekhidna sp. TaxID=2608089 RepID=UPI0032EDBEF6
MDKYGKLINDHTLYFERMLAGPIERVWEYLTDEKKRGLWFAGGSTDLIPKGEMKLIFHNSTLSPTPEPTPEKYKDFRDGFESIAIVLKAEPPHLLVLEWEGIVTFKLEEAGDKVKLTLTHENLKETKDARVGTLAGWHTHLDILVDLMNGREPEGFWSVHMKLEEEYEEKYF